jgi:uncharacterized protein YecE (DUF72 family)
LAVSHIGTSGWSYRHWGEGEFYPEKLRTHEQLGFYAEHFRTVELNVTFYRFCRETTYAKWTDNTPDDFVFALKMHRAVTHRLRLSGIAEPLQDVLTASAVLGPKRGPVLFQLPPSLKADTGRLREALDLLPAGVSSAWECRHESWFGAPTYALLSEANAALCIADSPRYPLVEHPTADWVYVRLRTGTSGCTPHRTLTTNLASGRARSRGGWTRAGRPMCTSTTTPRELLHTTRWR